MGGSVTKIVYIGMYRGKQKTDTAKKKLSVEDCNRPPPCPSVMAGGSGGRFGRKRSRRKMKIRTGTKATTGFIVQNDKNENKFRPSPNGDIIRFTDTSWDNRGVSGYAPAIGAKLITSGTPESLATWEVSCYPLDIDTMGRKE
jgi:hypothetical protein